MFDIARPVLVFDTQCHNVLTGRLHGYIFRYYEFHYRKPRELFFTDPIEARVFAQKKGADFSTNADMQPEVVTALDYVMNHDPFVHYPQPLDMHEGDDWRDIERRKADAQRKRDWRALETLDPDELNSESESDPQIDYFGDGGEA